MRWVILTPSFYRKTKDSGSAVLHLPSSVRIAIGPKSESAHYVASVMSRVPVIEQRKSLAAQVRIDFLTLGTHHRVPDTDDIN